jgi:CO/xanthine dehydrogenase FAD-binding subunit
MEVVYQARTLSMGWCLDCHRNPDARLRPPELVTAMDWPPPGTDRLAVGRKVREQYALAPSEDCSTCHR